MVQLIILVLIILSSTSTPLIVRAPPVCIWLNSSCILFFQKDIVIHSTVHYAYTRINQFVFANSRYALVWPVGQASLASSWDARKLASKLDHQTGHFGHKARNYDEINNSRAASSLSHLPANDPIPLQASSAAPRPFRSVIKPLPLWSLQKSCCAAQPPLF